MRISKWGKSHQFVDESESIGKKKEESSEDQLGNGRSPRRKEEGHSRLKHVSSKCRNSSFSTAGYFNLFGTWTHFPGSLEEEACNTIHMSKPFRDFDRIKYSCEKYYTFISMIISPQFNCDWDNINISLTSKIRSTVYTIFSTVWKLWCHECSNVYCHSQNHWTNSSSVQSESYNNISEEVENLVK